MILTVTYQGMLSLPHGGEMPTEKYLQLTNVGTSDSSISLNSRTAGTVYLESGTTVNFSPDTPVEFTVPANESVRITGYSRSRNTQKPITSTEGSKFTIDRFDETLTSMDYAFCGWEGLVAINSWEGASAVTSLGQAFKDCTSLKTIPNSWGTLTKVTSLGEAFRNCSSLIAIPDSWTGLNNVTWMSYAFAGCSSIVTGGTSNLNKLSKVEYFREAFNGCSSWTADTYELYYYLQNKYAQGSANLREYNNAFLGCSSSTNWGKVPYGWGGQNTPPSFPTNYMQFNVGNVGIRISNVKLGSCNYIIQYKDGRYEYGGPEYGTYDFATKCSGGTTWLAGSTIKIWNFTRNQSSTSGGITSYYAGIQFNDTQKATAGHPITLEIERFYSGVTYKQFFSYRGSDIDVTIKSWTGLTSDSLEHAFSNGFETITLPSTGFVGLESVTNIKYAFYNTPITNFPSSWSGLNNVTDMQYAFSNTGIAHLPSSWNGLGKATNMSGAFSKNPIDALPSTWAGLGNGSAINFTYTFGYCWNIKTIPLTGFASLNSSAYYQMFASCSSITNAYEAYQAIASKSSISHSNAFRSCESDPNWSNIPSGWGGPEADRIYVDVKIKFADTTFDPYSVTPIYGNNGPQYFGKDSEPGVYFARVTRYYDSTYSKYAGNIFDLLQSFKYTEFSIEDITVHGDLQTWDFSPVTLSGNDCIYLTDISDTAVNTLNSYHPTYSKFTGLPMLTKIPAFDLSTVSGAGSLFTNNPNVKSGILDAYNQLLTVPKAVSSHSNCFTNCGSNTETGAAELAQIPTGWGGTLVA